MKFAYFVTNSTDGSGSTADDRKREKEERDKPDKQKQKQYFKNHMFLRKVSKFNPVFNQVSFNFRDVCV